MCVCLTHFAAPETNTPLEINYTPIKKVIKIVKQKWSQIQKNKLTVTKDKRREGLLGRLGLTHVH